MSLNTHPNPNQPGVSLTQPGGAELSTRCWPRWSPLSWGISREQPRYQARLCLHEGLLCVALGIIFSLSLFSSTAFYYRLAVFWVGCAEPELARISPGHCQGRRRRSKASKAPLPWLQRAPGAPGRAAQASGSRRHRLSPHTAPAPSGDTAAEGNGAIHSSANLVISVWQSRGKGWAEP